MAGEEDRWEQQKVRTSSVQILCRRKKLLARYYVMCGEFDVSHLRDVWRSLLRPISRTDSVAPRPISRSLSLSLSVSVSTFSLAVHIAVGDLNVPDDEHSPCLRVNLCFGSFDSSRGDPALLLESLFLCRLHLLLLCNGVLCCAGVQ